MREKGMWCEARKNNMHSGLVFQGNRQEASVAEGGGAHQKNQGPRHMGPREWTLDFIPNQMGRHLEGSE